LHGRFNGFSLGLYKNGSLINSTLITGSNVGYSANNRFLVGGISQFTGSYLSGSVANVAVYSTSLSSYSITTNYNGLATRFGLTNIVTPTVDEDVQAFIEAAGITDPTEVSAITNLVVDLKTFNIWDKMKAMYPMVGGTATSQKYNLKNPNTFIGTFIGGWVHSSTGATPNGVNAYMNTGLNMASELINTNSHASVYTRTNIVSNTVSIGGSGAGLSGGLYIYPRLLSTVAYFGAFNNTGGNSSAPVLNSLGLSIISRLNLIQETFYKNLSKTTNTNSVTSPTSQNIYIGANNFNGVASNFDTRENAFASIGDGLTDTEAANFYTAVQTFQTTLGRQV
jgi:hypothetical protein